MVHIIIGVLVWLIITIIRYNIYKKKGKNIDTEDFANCFVYGLLAVVISMLITMIYYEPNYELAKTQEIESLDILNGSSGNFVLGIGSTNNQAVYYYYVRDEKGLYELKSINGNSIKIKQEGTDNRAYIERYEPIFKDAIMFWTLERKYIIVVPENTIQKDFNANIK